MKTSARTWSDWPIQLIKLEDKNYPAVLKKIKNPPSKLFYRGSLSENLFKKTLAIVGSRRITQYGKNVTDQLISSLVNQKITVISGFMYGIDTLAHQKTLENDGKTIAVFGCGLNIVYPQENQTLYSQILATGGVVFSEYEPEFKPKLWTFPQRNRIIAGLATLGVLVIEAGIKSGSLITAQLAKQQGKKVFAVPGPITSSSSLGTNQLIKNNQAKMVLEANDILAGKTTNPSLFEALTLTPMETKICQTLQAEPLVIDELAKLIEQNVAEAGKIISLMSLKGIIEEVAGRYYFKK